jgi:hypothetical protein
MPAIKFLTALLLLTFFSSCDPAILLGPQAARADQYNLRIDYHRSGCYGRCEIYGLKVYDNGLLVFTGERFTDRPGTWEKSIDRRRVTVLLDSFERADFASYPRSFKGMIADAATVQVNYYDAAGKLYQTSFKAEAPKELRDLSDVLHQLAHLPDYRQVSDTIASFRRQAVANTDREELIVQLKDGVVAETWVIKYGKQNVALKSRISPNGNYYVITSDPNIMAAEELLTFLRQDASVVSAQENQQVSPR